jgi:hypothetical protein
MSTTFAKSRNKQKINWKRIISNPNTDLSDYAEDMDDWTTCFCGQLSVKIPRKSDNDPRIDGVPLDNVLHALCGETAMDVFLSAMRDDDNRPNLLNLLSLIEQRSEFILSKMKKTK